MGILTAGVEIPNKGSSGNYVCIVLDVALLSLITGTILKFEMDIQQKNLARESTEGQNMILLWNRCLERKMGYHGIKISMIME